MVLKLSLPMAASVNALNIQLGGEVIKHNVDVQYGAAEKNPFAERAFGRRFHDYQRLYAVVTTGVPTR